MYFIELLHWSADSLPLVPPRVSQVLKNLLMQETQAKWIQSLDWEEPQSRIWKPPPVFLPGKVHGQRNLTDYSHGTAKSNMTQQLSTYLLLIYNIVSTLQQSDSAIHICTYILLHIIFHYSLLIMNIVPCPVK